jgi:mitochondrial-processing peptidase subunit beta
MLHHILCCVISYTIVSFVSPVDLVVIYAFVVCVCVCFELYLLVLLSRATWALSHFERIKLYVHFSHTTVSLNSSSLFFVFCLLFFVYVFIFYSIGFPSSIFHFFIFVIVFFLSLLLSFLLFKPFSFAFSSISFLAKLINMFTNVFRRAASVLQRRSVNIARASARTSVAQRHFSSDVRSTLADYPASEITALDNGLRVASHNMKGETATVGVHIDAGSRYEDNATNGAAHFLEHIIFKGTNSRTQQQLEKEIENMGGHLNAYTSRESTVYYAKVFKKDVPKAVEILGDILQNSNLSDNSIAIERDVILREMQEVEGQIEEVIFDRLHETAFRGSPLGNTILGPVENIQSMTRETIANYIGTHYTAPRMVVAGAGEIDHKEFEASVGKHFGNLPTTPTTTSSAEKPSARFVGSEIRVRYDDMPHAHVAIAWPTAGWADGDQFALAALQHLIGSYHQGAIGAKDSASELVADLAADDSALSLTPFLTSYSDIGLFGAYVVTDPYKVDDVVHRTMKEVTGFAYHINEKRLASVKNHMLMQFMSQLDGTTATFEELGRQVVCYGRRMHPLEVVDRIEALDAKSVQAVANRFLYDQDVAVAAIGNIYELMDYNRMRSRTYYPQF